jgi:heat shock protein HslJ
MSKQFSAPRRAALHTRSARCAVALGAAALVAACAIPTHPDTSAPPSNPFNPAAPQLLDDTAWTLTSWQTSGGTSRALPAADGAKRDEAGGVPTLVFSTATGQRLASGIAGCNRFSGPYSLKAGKLAFGPLAATGLPCPGAEGELERAYLDALAHVNKTGVQWSPRQQLELVTEDGTTLRFVSAGR